MCKSSCAALSFSRSCSSMQYSHECCWWSHGRTCKSDKCMHNVNTLLVGHFSLFFCLLFWLSTQNTVSLGRFFFPGGKFLLSVIIIQLLLLTLVDGLDTIFCFYLLVRTGDIISNLDFFLFGAVWELQTVVTLSKSIHTFTDSELTNVVNSEVFLEFRFTTTCIL